MKQFFYLKKELAMAHKNRVLFYLFAAVTACNAHANYKDSVDRSVLVEIKGAYNLPADKTFRKIYRNGGSVVGEASVQLVENKPWFGWASVGVLKMEQGKSVGACSSTNATIVPIAGGLKYFLAFNPGDLYVGLGVLGAHLKTKDHSPFVIEDRSKWGVGGIAKIGFLFDLPQSWFVDLFSDYSFVKVNFSNKFECGVQSHKANISNWSVGLGVGYRFS